MSDFAARQAVGAVFSSTATLPAVATLGRPAMGGQARITLVGASASLLGACGELLARCEYLWSRFLPESDITRLNLAEGEITAVDPLTVELVRAMQHGQSITAGAFDPTLLPSLVASGYGHSRVDPTRGTLLPASAV